MKHYLSRIFRDTSAGVPFTDGVWKHAFQALNPGVPYKGGQIKWKGSADAFAKVILIQVADNITVNEGPGLFLLAASKAILSSPAFKTKLMNIGLTDAEATDITTKATLIAAWKALHDLNVGDVS